MLVRRKDNKVKVSFIFKLCTTGDLAKTLQIRWQSEIKGVLSLFVVATRFYFYCGIKIVHEVFAHNFNGQGVIFVKC